jgi:glycosyltransferase involved in cell wall biosynthesis
LGIPSDSVVVGHVARWSPEKDHLGFIQAAGLAAARMPALRLLMMGTGVDSQNTVLMRAVQSAGLGGKVELLGERADIPECLAAMDLFCLSSLHEGFPNVLGEAMAMALPCITTRAGDAEFLAGSAAIVVDCGDSTAMARALVDLAQAGPAVWCERGAQARERIVSEFSIETMQTRFSNLYSSLTEGRPASNKE